MAIKIDEEQVITFPGLASSLPRRRRNRPVHVSTIHRWRDPGLRGIRLEAVRIGGAWHTSWEAFSRFCERLTAAELGNNCPIVTSVGTQSEHKSADSDLAAENW
jgi:hypothetical protein